MNNNFFELDNITPEHFANIQKNISNQLGVSIAGNTGEIEQHGVGVKWEYSPDTQKLIITNVKKPIFVTEEFVLNRLKEACV